MHASNMPLSRRQFLGRAAGAAAFTIVPRSVLGGPGRPAPGDKITHAILGVGGMGRGHISYVVNDPEARLVALCDVDRGHLRAGLEIAARAGHECKGYRDFRELLAAGGVDVIHIATPPHWHAAMAVAAADAGCDIWCEKPMTRAIGEGLPVIDAVRRNGRVFRLNTWFRFSSGLYGLGCPARPLKKLVRSGLLGWPLTVRVNPSTGFDWKIRAWSGRTDLEPRPVPPELDWELWLGPAPEKPYHPHRCHQSFRGYWDYDGGGLADMGQHYLDPVQYLLDKDHTSPVSVHAEAPWPPHPDAVGLWGRVELAYADGCRILLESGEWGAPRDRGLAYIEGPGGKVFPGVRTEPADLWEAVASLPEPEPQVTDFNTSLRTRRRFALHEGNGHRSNLLVHLANAAIRLGRPLAFDPERLCFPGDEEANRLLDPPRRPPWNL